MAGCHDEFASYAHGSKGSRDHFHVQPCPGQGAGLSKAKAFARADMLWAFPQPEPNPYQLEWDDLIEAIRQDTPYNEAKRGAEASLVSSMGRMAAHTGQIVEWDDILNSEHEFAPDVDKLAMDSTAAADCRLGRQVSHSPAGHPQRPRDGSGDWRNRWQSVGRIGRRGQGEKKSTVGAPPLTGGVRAEV